jgi:hypothetical protein
MAVRSNLPVTTNDALHQLEPNPPGLIGVKLDVKVAAMWLDVIADCRRRDDAALRAILT